MLSCTTETTESEFGLATTNPKSTDRIAKTKSSGICSKLSPGEILHSPRKRKNVASKEHAWEGDVSVEEEVGSQEPLTPVLRDEDFEVWYTSPMENMFASAVNSTTRRLFNRTTAENGQEGKFQELLQPVQESSAISDESWHFYKATAEQEEKNVQASEMQNVTKDDGLSSASILSPLECRTDSPVFSRPLYDRASVEKPGEPDVLAQCNELQQNVDEITSRFSVMPSVSNANLLYNNTWLGCVDDPVFFVEQSKASQQDHFQFPVIKNTSSLFSVIGNSDDPGFCVENKEKDGQEFYEGMTTSMTHVVTSLADLVESPACDSKSKLSPDVHVLQGEMEAFMFENEVMQEGENVCDAAIAECQSSDHGEEGNILGKGATTEEHFSSIHGFCEPHQAGDESARSEQQFYNMEWDVNTFPGVQSAEVAEEQDNCHKKGETDSKSLGLCEAVEALLAASEEERSVTHSDADTLVVTTSKVDHKRFIPGTCIWSPIPATSPLGKASFMSSLYRFESPLNLKELDFNFSLAGSISADILSTLATDIPFVDNREKESLLLSPSSVLMGCSKFFTSCSASCGLGEQFEYLRQQSLHELELLGDIGFSFVGENDCNYEPKSNSPQIGLLSLETALTCLDLGVTADSSLRESAIAPTTTESIWQFCETLSQHSDDWHLWDLTSTVIDGPLWRSLTSEAAKLVDHLPGSHEDCSKNDTEEELNADTVLHVAVDDVTDAQHPKVKRERSLSLDSADLYGSPGKWLDSGLMHSISNEHVPEDDEVTNSLHRKNVFHSEPAIGPEHFSHHFGESKFIEVRALPTSLRAVFMRHETTKPVQEMDLLKPRGNDAHEDLLTSPKTHFRPIKPEEDVELDGTCHPKSLEDEDDAFWIPEISVQKQEFQLKDDFHTYIDDEDDSDSESFAPKFKKVHPDKYSQTDGTGFLSEPDSADEDELDRESLSQAMENLCMDVDEAEKHLQEMTQAVEKLISEPEGRPCSCATELDHICKQNSKQCSSHTSKQNTFVEAEPEKDGIEQAEYPEKDGIEQEEYPDIGIESESPDVLVSSEEEPDDIWCSAPSSISTDHQHPENGQTLGSVGKFKQASVVGATVEEESSEGCNSDCEAGIDDILKEVPRSIWYVDLQPEEQFDVFKEGRNVESEKKERTSNLLNCWLTTQPQDHNSTDLCAVDRSMWPIGGEENAWKSELPSTANKRIPTCDIESDLICANDAWTVRKEDLETNLDAWAVQDNSSSVNDKWQDKGSRKKDEIWSCMQNQHADIRDWDASLPATRDGNVQSVPATKTQNTNWLTEQPDCQQQPEVQTRSTDYWPSQLHVLPEKDRWSVPSEEDLSAKVTDRRKALEVWNSLQELGQPKAKHDWSMDSVEGNLGDWDDCTEEQRAMRTWGSQQEITSINKGWPRENSEPDWSRDHVHGQPREAENWKKAFRFAANMNPTEAFGRWGPDSEYQHQATVARKSSFSYGLVESNPSETSAVERCDLIDIDAQHGLTSEINFEEKQPLKRTRSWLDQEYEQASILTTQHTSPWPDREKLKSGSLEKMKLELNKEHNELLCDIENLRNTGSHRVKKEDAHCESLGFPRQKKEDSWSRTDDFKSTDGISPFATWPRKTTSWGKTGTCNPSDASEQSLAGWTGPHMADYCRGINSMWHSRSIDKRCRDGGSTSDAVETGKQLYGIADRHELMRSERIYQSGSQPPGGIFDSLQCRHPEKIYQSGSQPRGGIFDSIPCTHPVKTYQSASQPPGRVFDELQCTRPEKIYQLGSQPPGRVADMSELTCSERTYQSGCRPSGPLTFAVTEDDLQSYVERNSTRSKDKGEGACCRSPSDHCTSSGDAEAEFGWKATRNQVEESISGSLKKAVDSRSDDRPSRETSSVSTTHLS